MAVAGPACEDQLRELFGGLGDITLRAMFGGAGVYCDEVMFALIDGESTIFLKAEGVLARALAAGGSEPFTYQRDGAARTINYWRMPEDGLEDPAEARLWASRSLDIARAARKG
ncbi:MAG: competence protein TfoX [Rhodobacteraceae bacterium]|nr:competence protein TfoX [Paracoccaceae bacterium]MBR29144.1 competence protein TfoX [Paracoccaceae bacterium]